MALSWTLAFSNDSFAKSVCHWTWKGNHLPLLAICTDIILIGAFRLLVQAKDPGLNFYNYSSGYLEGSEGEGHELYT